jgi:hypothetical protein
MKKNNILMFLVLCVLGLNRMDHMYDCGKGGTASAEGTWSISVADGISDPRIDSRNRTLPGGVIPPGIYFRIPLHVNEDPLGCNKTVAGH